MLKAELKYPDGSGGYETIQVPNVIDIDIANESITGFSFWQVEGGTAKIDCFMFPELQAVLEQQPLLYFDCEFKIYEGVDGIVGDLFDQNIFLGYLKRGNYEYADDDNISLAESEIILTVHNPLKKLIESMPNQLYFIADPQTAYNIDDTLRTELQFVIDTYVEQDTEIMLTDAYNALLTNPSSVSQLRIFDEANYPLLAPEVSWAGNTAITDIKQFRVYSAANQDYLYYYRNVTRRKAIFKIAGRYVHYAYQCIRYNVWQILGSSLIRPLTGTGLAPAVYIALQGQSTFFNANSPTTGLNTHNQTPAEWYDSLDQSEEYPPMTIVSQPGNIQLTGDNRFLRVIKSTDNTVNMTIDYTGRAGYIAVQIPTRISKMKDILAGMLRANLASLTCKYDTIAIANKIVDSYEPIPASNPILGYPKVKSNPWENDAISPNDLPFGIVSSDPNHPNMIPITMANGINDYFKSITRTHLPEEIAFDIDLNPISEDITQLTIEIGKTYDFGTFYVYVTDMKVDYENRTARIKGLGKVV